MTPEPKLFQETIKKTVYVRDLDSAVEAYWSAKSRREDQAAYHEILLFGGVDGYPSSPPLRAAIVRRLRQLALWIECL